MHELKPDPFTVLGWDVADIEGTVDRLTGAGVVFNRYKGVNDDEPARHLELAERRAGGVV